MDRQVTIRGWRPAQPAQASPKKKSPWAFAACAALALALMVLTLPRPQAAVEAAVPPQEEAPAPVLAQPAFPPKNVRFGLEGEAAAVTMPYQHLLKGRMLLVDETHPLPQGWQPADTLNILGHTAGRVTCRDTAAVLGEDTLAALKELFVDALHARVIQLTVFAGTRSQEQQRQLQADALDALSRDMSLEAALRQAQARIASPGCSEHQTAWAVDIRVCPRWDSPAHEAPLASSQAGQWLLEHAWEYGFIHRYPDAQVESYSCRAYHFRYVGRAHAMLMHALDLSLEDYLALLHRQGSITLYNEENAPLATAVCAAMGERSASLLMPAGAQVEDASLDNLGWAVVSCLYE